MGKAGKLRPENFPATNCSGNKSKPESLIELHRNICVQSLHKRKSLQFAPDSLFKDCGKARFIRAPSRSLTLWMISRDLLGISLSGAISYGVDIMEKIILTFEVPRYSVISTRRGAEAKLDRSKLPAEMLPLIFDNGEAQKTRDAASSAARLTAIDKFGSDKVGTSLTKEQKAFVASPEGTDAARKHEQALIDKAIESLLAGEWTQRAASVTVDDRTAAIIRLFQAALPEAKRKAFGDLDSQTQIDKAMANESAFDAEAIDNEIANIESERAERERKRAAKAEREAQAASIGDKLKIDF